jgi:malonate-semialdehyde dehydrogenase (acetylating)/methylmalonate-semialdehyde dehydrogenase
MEAAVAAAKAAFPAWRNTSVSVRSRIMFKLQQLIREHTDEMADVITVELGKVTADAKGDIFRGLEIVEQSCAMGQTMLGDTLNNVSANMDTVMIRQPLGVCAGITPFNFPAMIPLWMFPGKRCGCYSRLVCVRCPHWLDKCRGPQLRLRPAIPL